MSFTIPSGESPRIRIAIGGGQVRVQAEDRADVLVRSGASEDELHREDGGEITIRPRNRTAKVVLRVPRGAELVIGTVNGSVTVEGGVATVRANTKSGAIRIDRARTVDARSLSGSIQIGSCGLCRAKVASGRIRIDHADRVEISAISGRVEVRQLAEHGRIRSVSGSVELAGSATSSISAESVSGRLTITVPPGARPDYRLRSGTGRVSADVEQGSDGQIRARTLSGAIRVQWQ